MADDHSVESSSEEPKPGIDQRFPELAEIQREVELRIRDNQRFLDRFMDDDFPEEEEDSAEEDAPVEEL